MTMKLPFKVPFTLGGGPAPEPTIVKATARWDWLLCDGFGNPLAELRDSRRKTAHLQAQQLRRGAVHDLSRRCRGLPLPRSRVEGSATDASLLSPQRGESAGTLRFNGYLAPFTEVLEESKLITATFRSPFGRLVRRRRRAERSRCCGPGLTAEEKNADDIAASLIKLYGGAGKVGEADPNFNETVYEGVQAEYPISLAIGNLAKQSSDTSPTSTPTSGRRSSISRRCPSKASTSKVIRRRRHDARVLQHL